jgi:MFS family permease
MAAAVVLATAGGVGALLAGRVLQGLATGGALVGIGMGAGLQGGFRTVVPLAPPRERAGVLLVLYVISYCGMGILPSSPGSSRRPPRRGGAA